MLKNLLNKTCDVYRLTVARSGMGSQKRTYTLRINDIKCAFMSKQTQSSGEVEQFDKTTSAYRYIFYAEYNSTNTAITESDKIVYDGRDFEVVNIYNASGRNHHLQIAVEELR